MMEEQELALRCARGDNAARRELYVQYGSRILALCRRYVSDPADAEDLKQDAFVKIYRVIGRFRWTRPGSLYAWMSRVTINMAFDSYGKRRRLARQLVDVEEMENVLPDESTREEAASVPPEVLAAMIEALPEGYRTVFKLYCIDGLSHKDIAALLGIKEKSSSASLSRARALLSDAIREYWRSQEEGTSPESWSRILRKMHRAAALRASAIAVALLLPVTSLLLWHSTRRPSAPTLAETTPTIPDEPSPIIEEPTAIQEDTFVIPSIPSVVPSDSSVIPSEAKESVPSETPTSPQEPRYEPRKESRQDTHPDSIDPFLTLPEQIQRQRPRVTLGFRAGSGTNRRNTEVSLNSTPYIAALTYMNEIDPQFRPDVKSNYGNAMEWLVNNTAPGSYTSAVNHYRHDLPVSLGLTARMELTPRVGVESGLVNILICIPPSFRRPCRWTSGCISWAFPSGWMPGYGPGTASTCMPVWAPRRKSAFPLPWARSSVRNRACSGPRRHLPASNIGLPPGPISISSRRFPTVSRRRTSSHTVLKPRWCSRSMQVCVLT